MQRPTTNAPYQAQTLALPEPHNARIRPMPISQQERPTQPISHYRYSDDYTPALSADVVEDWEEQDDATGMRYGDWEEQDEGEVVTSMLSHNPATLTHIQAMSHAISRIPTTPKLRHALRAICGCL
jgi:hypothetical protein